MRHLATVSAIRCVILVGAIALLGCDPAANRLPSAPSALNSLAPTAVDVGAGSAATVVSWACLAGGADRGDFVANGWTIKRDPCASAATSRVMTSATGMPLFAPAPTNLRLTLAGSTVQLDWDQRPSASAWQLEAGSGFGRSDLVVFRTTARTVTVTGVQQRACRRPRQTASTTRAFPRGRPARPARPPMKSALWCRCKWCRCHPRPWPTLHTSARRGYRPAHPGVSSTRRCPPAAA
jgi:hypothetical protein